MEGCGNFRIIYSEETIEFLNRLEEKAKAKIMYNINKCKYVIDNELFKKLEDSDIWEFVLCTMESHTGYWHFGIQRKKL